MLHDSVICYSSIYYYEEIRDDGDEYEWYEGSSSRSIHGSVHER